MKHEFSRFYFRSLLAFEIARCKPKSNANSSMLVLSISVGEAMIKKNSHIYSIKEDVCCYKSEKTINFVRTEATAGTAGQTVN